jgi:hypothetical protein
MYPFRTWIGEEGVVHPRYPWHDSNLRPDDTAERSVLYLVEEDIEGIRAMSLIDVQGVIARHTEVRA